MNRRRGLLIPVLLVFGVVADAISASGVGGGTAGSLSTVSPLSSDGPYAREPVAAPSSSSEPEYGRRQTAEGEEGSNVDVGASAAKEEADFSASDYLPPSPQDDSSRSMDEVKLLPQQRVIRYLLTDDPTFSVQIGCSALFLASTFAYGIAGGEGGRASGALYQCAIGCIALKEWGSLLQRVRQSLLPHLLAKPLQYDLFRASAASIADDPCVQHLAYCVIFLAAPMGQALVPLAVREIVYILLVGRQVLTLSSLDRHFVFLFRALRRPLSMLVAPKVVWEALDSGERRRLLGLRVAQGCYRLDIALIFPLCIRYGLKIRGCWDLLGFVALLSIYCRLLSVKGRQLQSYSHIAGAHVNSGVARKLAIDALAFMTAGAPAAVAFFLALLVKVYNILRSDDPLGSLLSLNQGESGRDEVDSVDDPEVQTNDWLTIVSVALGLKS